MLPDDGVVLGVDVGFSETSPSTCFCVLEWTRTEAKVGFSLTTANKAQREDAIDRLTKARQLNAVALDGPLTSGFKLAHYYRAAEALLSRGTLQKRGKPGQTSSPVGQKLHSHALMIAEQVASRASIDTASHSDPIDARRIVEAFPNMYLGALIPEARLPKVNRDASDVYWEALAADSGLLMRHIRRLLPGRTIRFRCAEIDHHDRRAGAVCAMTALAVTRGTHVAVGDPVGGDIMLPPRMDWGRSNANQIPWLEAQLRANLSKVVKDKKNHATHRQARIIDQATCW